MEYRPHPEHRARVVPVDRSLLQLATAAIRGFVVAVSVQKAEVGREQERPGIRPRLLVGVEQGDCCVGVRDSAVEVAVVPEPRSRGVRACRQLCIACVLERVEDEAVAGVAFSLVPEAVAEVAQELGAQVAVHRRRRRTLPAPRAKLPTLRRRGGGGRA